jgi:hypothetical protein
MEVSTDGRWRSEEGRLGIGQGLKGLAEVQFFLLSEVMPLLSYYLRAKLSIAIRGLRDNVQTAHLGRHLILLFPNSLP